MTRRLIMLDLTAAEYKFVRFSLNHSRDIFASCGGKRSVQNIDKILNKIDDAWNAKGRNGRGYNTKMTIKEIADLTPMKDEI